MSQALQQGSERAETGVRCLQDAFRYQGSLPSMDVPQSWRPFLQGMQSVVVADLSDLIESDLPAHATSVMPIKAAFAFLSAASDAVGILASCMHLSSVFESVICFGFFREANL